LFSLDHQKLAGFDGSDGRRACTPVDQRHFAEHFALGHDTEHRVASIRSVRHHLEAPPFDREQRLRGLALGDYDLTADVRADLANRSDPRQLLPVQIHEQGDRLEQLLMLLEHFGGLARRGVKRFIPPVGP